MAAGLGFKTFTTGEVLTAADVNGYLMQGVLVFATEAARNSAITSPQEGQFAFTKDTNSLWYYSGSAWVASGATGDIEGVTAGTGISGGGTSGTVTITNSMATAIDAKGDLVVGTGADAFSRLAVGTNGQVLTADSSEATGLKFATPAGGGFTFAAYTPTYTNFTLGNGTVIARYAESGKLVYFQVQVTFGSTTSVSGLIKISLPVTAKNNGNAVTIPALFTDAGLNEYIGFGAINQTDNVVSLFAEDASATYLKYALTSSTVPFTWATADVINVSGSYEAN